MAQLGLAVLLVLVVTVTSEGPHGGGHHGGGHHGGGHHGGGYDYSVRVSPRGQKISVRGVRRPNYSKELAFRSYFGYDEADAVRTADRDIIKYKPVYKPVVATNRRAHAPVHTTHPAHVATGHKVHAAPADYVPMHTTHPVLAFVGHKVHDAPANYVPVHNAYPVLGFAGHKVRAEPADYVPVHTTHPVLAFAGHKVHHTPTNYIPVHNAYPLPAVPGNEVHAAPTDHVPVHGAFVPYQYDYHTEPRCALANRHLYNITVCLEDAEYPTEAVLHELKRNPALTDRIMSDVTYQSADNLVDGLTKAEEQQYSHEHYYGVAGPRDHLPQTGYSYSEAYRREGGYICPSDVFYTRVKRAVNTFGEWKVIVNMPDALLHDPAYKKFVQTSRLESCIHHGSACSFVDHLSSECLQKYAFVRLVAYDSERGLHTDSFKLPSACSCHLSAMGRIIYS